PGAGPGGRRPPRGGPSANGGGVRGRWGRWGAGVWGVAGVSPRPVGHPEGYPEPGGAARPGRFAVASRAWHPRRNPGTGGACPTDRGEPPPTGREPWRTPPGEVQAGATRHRVRYVSTLPSRSALRTTRPVTRRRCPSSGNGLVIESHA